MRTADMKAVSVATRPDARAPGDLPGSRKPRRNAGAEPSTDGRGGFRTAIRRAGLSARLIGLGRSDARAILTFRAEAEKPTNHGGSRLGRAALVGNVDAHYCIEAKAAVDHRAAACDSSRHRGGEFPDRATSRGSGSSLPWRARAGRLRPLPRPRRTSGFLRTLRVARDRASACEEHVDQQRQVGEAIPQEHSAHPSWEGRIG
jgi:hypothetical protein